MSSHKTECESYAVVRAEQVLDDRGEMPSARRVEQFASELLSEGDVTCICPELPS